MTLNYKYTILYTVVSLLLFWIVIKYGNSLISKVCSSKILVEGLTDFENVRING